MISINGTLQEATQDTVWINNRGFNYGDSLFETLRVSNGKILFWEDHYFRLMSSMRIMRMDIPLEFTMEFLEQKLMEVSSAIQAKNQAVRLRFTVFRDSTGYYTPNSNTVGYVIQGNELAQSFYTISQEDYPVELYKDHYLSPSLLSTIKTSNKAINVLGSIYAQENDYSNCLLLNTKKEVVEALNGNLFLVKGNTIKTPPRSSGCLQGIMRKQLIGILAKLPDYILEEAIISPFELQQADELFITNVVVGLRPITQYRKKQYNSNVARDLLGKLNARIRLS